MVSGSVSSIEEAVDWLGHTYLYVRMMRSPHVYGISEGEKEIDPLLERRRADLAHTAATLLQKSRLVDYDRSTGALCSTDLGRVAAHYYMSFASMKTFLKFLKPEMRDIGPFAYFP